MDIDIEQVQDLDGWAYSMPDVVISNSQCDEAEEAAEKEEEEEPEIFNPRPLKSRRMEVEALGEAGRYDDCFGCVYGDEQKTTIPSDDIHRLFEMSRQSFGRTNLISLSKAMAKYYKTMRKRINRDLQPGEEKLKPWTAAMILEHLRFHHQDPFVWQLVVGSELTEIRNEVTSHVIEVSNKTGRTRLNKTAIDALDKLIKLEVSLLGLAFKLSR